MDRRSAIAALLCAATTGFPRPAQAAEFGPKQVAALMLRVLAYDRNIKSRSNGKSAAVLILFQEGDQASETLQTDLLNALEDLAGSVSITGLPVKVASMANTTAAALDARLEALRPVALFVCSGLGSAVPGVSALARKRSVLTMTLNTAYIKAGLGIGLIEAEDRISIIVNLPATRAEGADLDASLLRVAEVYR